MSNAREILRKEATAVSFLELTESQREAIDKLSEFFQEALEASNKAPDEDRRSRVVLVSGVKGCGKTSLVHSLRKLMASQNVFNDFGGSFDGRSRDARTQEQANVPDVLRGFLRRRDKLSGRFGSQFHRSDRRVTWLETLYLDPMSPGTNLTAAVLARIHYHASKEDDRSRTSGLLDPMTHVDKAKHDLESLQSSAVTSLEGNLEQRAAAVDTDGFAVNAMDAERQKLRVAKKLNDILGSLAAGVAGDPSKVKGLFILPVDDMDVRPSRSIQMLKLASMLSIPRLFFMFLGELEAIDQILFYETQGEYIRLLGSALESRKDIAQDIEEKSNEIASSLLRKMLPPAQRIRLEPMSLGEALLYPQGFKVFHDLRFGELDEDKRPTLNTLLSEIKVPLALAWSNGKKERESTLLDLLCPAHIVPEEAATPSAASSASKPASILQRESHYDGSRLLAGPPRQVADLWAELHEVMHSDQEPQAQVDNNTKHARSVISILVDTLKSVVDEDPNPGVSVQRALKGAATPPERADALWELSPPDIHVVSTFGDKLEFTFDNHNDSLLISRVVAQEVMVHELFARNPRALPNERSPFRPLGPRSRVAYKATHDLLRMTGQGVVTRPFVHKNRMDMACSVWDDGRSEPLVIPWSYTDWMTFWHQDTYTALWNKGMAVVRRIANERSDLKAPDLALLLLIYRVRAAVAAIKASPGIAANIEDKLLKPKRSDKWRFDDLGALKVIDSMFEQLSGIASYVSEQREDGQDDAEAEFIDEVLLDIALLATPEILNAITCAPAKTDAKQETAHKRPMSYSSEKLDVYQRLRSGLRDFAIRLFHVEENPTDKSHGISRSELLPRFRRLRLERIGAHISTPIGNAFVKPGSTTTDADPLQHLRKQVSEWVSGSGDVPKALYLEFRPHEVEVFFERERRRHFPKRSERERWKVLPASSKAQP